MKWRDPNWYRYLWYNRIGSRLKVAMLVPVLGLCAFGGLWAATSYGSGTSTGTYVPLMTTVQKVVRVSEHGRVVFKRIRVVKRIYAKPVTVRETRTIQTPSGPRVVTRDVVRYQPVYRRKVVTIRGKQVTVNQIVTNTQMLTNTQLLTVTNEHTVVQTNEHTVNQTFTNQQTQTQTQTLPAETFTVTGPTQTQTVVTTTPGETVTVTSSETVTVTAPADTITVTVTGP